MTWGMFLRSRKCPCHSHHLYLVSPRDANYMEKLPPEGSQPSWGPDRPGPATTLPPFPPCQSQRPSWGQRPVSEAPDSTQPPSPPPTGGWLHQGSSSGDAAHSLGAWLQPGTTVRATQAASMHASTGCGSDSTNQGDNWAGQPPLPRQGQGVSGGQPEEQLWQESGSTAAEDVLLQVQAVIRDLAKGRPRRGKVVAAAAEGSGGGVTPMAADMGAAPGGDSFDLKRRELEMLHFELESKIGERQPGVVDSSLPPGIPEGGGGRRPATTSSSRAAAITDVEERIKRKLTELTQLTDSMHEPSAPSFDPIDGSGGRKRLAAADFSDGAATADRRAATVQH